MSHQQYCRLLHVSSDSGELCSIQVSETSIFIGDHPARIAESFSL
jgi:hypothetical protein